MRTSAQVVETSVTTTENSPSAVCSLQSAVYILYLVYILYPVCTLHSAVYILY